MQGKMAEITTQGIRYQDNLYTCSRAIAEQWFKQTSPFYMVQIPILFKDNLLFIVLESGELLSIVKISAVNIISENELREYFTKLNQLKSEFKTIKKGKS